ncbi:hypothetical protein D8834_05620 [Streptococcus oralis]|nr:hypothetical protein D8834_05620 [Streptococcus oralis]
MRKLELGQTRLVVHHSQCSISFQTVDSVNLASHMDTATIIQLNKGLIFTTKCCFLLDGFNGWIMTKDVTSCPSHIKQNFLGKLGFQTFLINGFKFAFLTGFLDSLFQTLVKGIFIRQFQGTFKNTMQEISVTASIRTKAQFFLQT